MSDPAPLKSMLKHGALVAAANWPVVLIQFIAESTFKLLVAVPVVGGAVLVALVLGGDLRQLLDGDAREILPSVAAALGDRPGALAAFGGALLVVIVGASALMVLVKGGTVTVLACGDRRGGQIGEAPVRLAALQRAACFSTDRFVIGSAHLFGRYVRLGGGLLVVYAASGGLYVAVVLGAVGWAERLGSALGWPGLAALASVLLVAWITVANLAYLLLQMVVACDDCTVGQAVRRVAWFLRVARRDVALLFGSILGLVVLAMATSVLATAGLGLISFVPLVGLAVFPLQAAAWLLRGLVFQYLGLTALGAYLARYRQARDPAVASGPGLVRTAS